MNNELLISIVNQVIYVPIRHHYKCRAIITYVKKPLQINPFMQNEPNFRKSQMNVTSLITADYENKTLSERGKNKPNTNPIQTQFKPNTKPIQSQYKPNTNPKQSQSKPISPPPKGVEK